MEQCTAYFVICLEIEEIGEIGGRAYLSDKNKSSFHGRMQHRKHQKGTI